MGKKLKGTQFGNKPITPVQNELNAIHYPFVPVDGAQRFNRSNMTPVIHYGH